VTNAGNHPADFARLAKIASDESFEVEVTDEAASTAMLAVQGPSARALVESLADGPLPERMTAAVGTVAGQSVLIAGTGYTGEDGVELLTSLEASVPVWDALIEAGATPCGLGSRDTLRLEACYHLYGNDLDPSRNPIEAGLGWACKEETGFIGSDAVAAARAQGTAEQLVAFEVTGAGIARTGNPVVGGGVVCSGTFSPTFELAIGMAYLPADKAAVGSHFDIDVRGKHRTAVVRERPIYRKG
jgi:aminomethyltransferase